MPNITYDFSTVRRPLFSPEFSLLLTGFSWPCRILSLCRPLPPIASCCSQRNSSPGEPAQVCTLGSIWKRWIDSSPQSPSAHRKWGCQEIQDSSMPMKNAGMLVLCWSKHFYIQCFHCELFCFVTWKAKRSILHTNKTPPCWRATAFLLLCAMWDSLGFEQLLRILWCSIPAFPSSQCLHSTELQLLGLHGDRPWLEAALLGHVLQDGPDGIVGVGLFAFNRK